MWKTATATATLTTAAGRGQTNRQQLCLLTRREAARALTLTRRPRKWVSRRAAGAMCHRGRRWRCSHPAQRREWLRASLQHGCLLRGIWLPGGDTCYCHGCTSGPRPVIPSSPFTFLIFSQRMFSPSKSGAITCKQPQSLTKMKLK